MKNIAKFVLVAMLLSFVVSVSYAYTTQAVYTGQLTDTPTKASQLQKAVSQKIDGEGSDSGSFYSPYQKVSTPSVQKPAVRRIARPNI
jgi:hypothetical protein